MRFYVSFGIGAVIMAASMCLSGRKYRIPAWKAVLCTLLVCASAYGGLKIMAFLESGSFQGRSFFGAFFFVPVFLALTARFLKVPALQLTDISAPAGCVMLAVQKINCYLDGCCYGKVLRTTFDGFDIRFPSQIAEAVNAAVLFAAMEILFFKKKTVGIVYPWTMILYGITRFILNLFRETKPFVWILPAGNFWSVISVLAGVCWLLVIMRKEKQN